MYPSYIQSFNCNLLRYQSWVLISANGKTLLRWLSRSLNHTLQSGTLYRMASQENGQRWHPVEPQAQGDGKSGLLVNNSLCNEKVPFVPHSKDQGESHQQN